MFGVADISPTSSDLAYTIVRIRGEFSETASIAPLYHGKEGYDYLSLFKKKCSESFLYKIITLRYKNFVEFICSKTMEAECSLLTL